MGATGRAGCNVVGDGSIRFAIKIESQVKIG
jgi:hypothetical protein